MTDELDDFYIQEYNEAFAELKGDIAEEDYDAVMLELVENFNKQHTDDGRADAQKNFLAAYDSVRGSGGFDKDCNDLLDYIAKADKKSRSEVNRWARNALKNGIKPKNMRHR